MAYILVTDVHGRQHLVPFYDDPGPWSFRSRTGLGLYILWICAKN